MMATKTLTHRLESHDAWQMRTGCIVNELSEGFQIKSEQGLVGARVAASCLLKPNIGDRVLWSGNESEAFILSVLERAEPDTCYQLQVPGDLELHAAGNMLLNSEVNLSLNSTNKTELNSEQVTVDVREAVVNAHQSHFTGLKSFFHIEKLSWVGKQIEQVAERVFQRFDSQTKKITGHEEKQTQSSRHFIEKDYLVQAQNSVHHAKKNLHLDGEKIHLG
ncbi:DUF3540 domain-containing protein [Vibrio sp. S4M6]|uniref:DUF3540 domain-containing protein n=1 Tax=Vibrio sinus TaxID=2946865 RepID=UPI00202A211F|nr:DUF3540 domain-containing protein [Vibrio sinus]MCL9782508.1 DUF3540 domain-containing protein [Vibrio sinus]